MKQKINIELFIFNLFKLAFILIISVTVNAQLPDKKLAEKYGLDILPPSEKIEPAPEWLQKADMITGSEKVWKDYKFILKDTLVTRIVRRRAGHISTEVTEHYPVETIGSFDGSGIMGIPLISHVPHSKKAFDEAHKQGFKVIPYVHFRCIHSYYADQDVFLFQHPEILLKDKAGKWVHIPMDGSDRLYRFITCANSPGYWRLSLDYVKKMMDLGADGVFIDNAGARFPCYGPDFNVPENSSKRNPEFKHYTHEHLFPDATHDYAWDQMLHNIRALVKSYGEDKVVVLNSTPFPKNGDAVMWESFIYSWAWEGRRHSWADVKKKAKDEEWFLSAGRRITALSFLNPSKKEVKDDAFWAFSAARLVDFIWWSTLEGTGAEILYQAHMGKGMEPLKEINELAYRIFENGVIVLNDSEEDKTIELPLPSNLNRAKRLLDLYDNSRVIQIRNKKIKISVPKKSARVYLLDLNL